MHKAIALDLDGTLLSSAGTVSPASLEVLPQLEALGWLVIIATARPVRSLRTILPAWFERFYWAACNGAWVVKSGEVLRRVEIQHEEARALADALIGADFRVSVEAQDTFYSDVVFPGGFINECHPMARFVQGDACKVLVSAEGGGLDRACRMVPASLGVTITDGGTLAQIAHRDCCKAKAVEYTLAREGLTFADLVAFGDDTNDVPLLRAAGCGVAMGNAVPEALAVADVITETNDADGVGVCLRRLAQGESLS